MLTNGTSALALNQVSSVFVIGESVRIRSKFYNDWESDTVVEISADGSRYRLAHDYVKAGVFTWTANELETSALALAPLPILEIVEKPAPVCPSTSREPHTTFEQNGHVFDVLKYDNENRVFQSQLSAVSYLLQVTHESNGQSTTTKSFINGRLISVQTWNINVYMAVRYSFLGYMPTVADAIAGAYNHLQSLVLAGKA